MVRQQICNLPWSNTLSVQVRPSAPFYFHKIFNGVLAQLVRASALHAEGRRLTSDILHSLLGVRLVEPPLFVYIDSILYGFIHTSLEET